MPRLQDLLAPTEKYLRYQGGCGTCPRKLVDYVAPTLEQTAVIGVGEAPGATDAKTGKSFTGKTGDTLRNTFAEFHIPDFSVTNVIHCRPPDNRQPTEKEISCCMNQHVTHEVGNYPFVVLIGNTAMDAFFPGRSKVMKGNLAYHPDYPNSRFYGMYNPAAISYRPELKDEFRAQVERLSRILKGEKPLFRIVQAEEFRVRFREMLENAKLLSFDIETHGKRWEPDAKLLSMACMPLVGNDVFAVHKDEVHWQWAQEQIAKFLTNPDNQVLGQNVGYDLNWMESELRFCTNLRHIHDIQALYYELEGEIQVGLKPLVSERLDGYRHLCPAPDQEKNTERLLLYNGEDVYHPRQLFLRDFPRLKPKTKDLYLRVTSPGSLSVNRIQTAGIYFRSEIWDQVRAEFLADRQRAIDAWAAADPEFNPGKYTTKKGFANLDSFLFDVKKYPVIRETETKERSTDDAVVKELIRRGYKELEYLSALRGIDKRISTYVNSFPKHVAQDRRIHASYHNTRVATGRLSSSDPNMQNNPRVNMADFDKETGLWRRPQIRHLFGAPPGCKFVSGDFSQIELRIAMSLADDPVGIQAYRDGKDLHILLAMVITKKTDPKLVTVDERFYAKSGNFGMIYGGSWYTLQQYAMDTYNIIISDEEAKRWAAGFFNTYLKLEPWHKDRRAYLRAEQGYMEGPTGHRWYYKNWDSGDSELRAHDERSAINMTCQGPAAHMMNRLVFLCQQRFYQEQITNQYLGTAPIVLTVHDQLAAEVDEVHVERAEKVMQECVQQVHHEESSWFKVPLVLDIDVSDIWDE